MQALNAAGADSTHGAADGTAPPAYYGDKAPDYNVALQHPISTVDGAPETTFLRILASNLPLSTLLFFSDFFRLFPIFAQACLRTPLRPTQLELLRWAPQLQATPEVHRALPRPRPGGFFSSRQWAARVGTQ